LVREFHPVYDILKGSGFYRTDKVLSDPDPDAVVP
jgi:predicted nucleic acid-binding Zn ribbon protein